MIRDVGDGTEIEYESRDPDGTLTAATVALSITDPAGTVTTPTPTNPSTGVYRHTIDLDLAGVWMWVWTVTGAVQDVAYGSVQAATPAPGIYADVPTLRSRMGITNGSSDDLLYDALASVSREIDSHCGRVFYQATTATARMYYPDSPMCAVVHDFYTTTGLVLATDSGDDGTYETAWSAADYQVEPLNGLVDGEAGWPSYVVRAVGDRTFPIGGKRPSLQVTAKWGWASIPDPVRQACLILAAETAKLAEAPWGIAGVSGFGPVRIRENQVAMSKLRKYRTQAAAAMVA